MKCLVHGLAGAQLELNIDEGTSIAELKGTIHDLWGIPLICQRILLGELVLGDAECLSSCDVAQDGQVSLTVLVTLESVFDDLASDVEQLQVAALSALAELGPQSGEDAKALVASILTKDRSPTSTVCAEAVRALTCMSSPITHADMACIWYCVHNYSSTRDLLMCCGARRFPEAVENALRKYATQGRQQCHESVSWIIGEAASRQKLDALDGQTPFVESFEWFDEPCSDGDYDCSSYDPDGNLIKALVAVASEDRACVAASCLDHLKHRVARVRRIAVKTLAHCADAHDDAIIKAVMEKSVDIAASVRCATLRSMLSLTNSSDPNFQLAVSKCADDADSGVRLAALGVCSEIVDVNDAFLIGVISRYLADPDWRIRQVAAQVLQEVDTDATDVTANLRWFNIPQVAAVLLGRLHPRVQSKDFKLAI